MTDHHDTKEGLLCECHCPEHGVVKDRPTVERPATPPKSAEEQEKERRKVANTGVEDLAPPAPTAEEPE